MKSGEKRRYGRGKETPFTITITAVERRVYVKENQMPKIRFSPVLQTAKVKEEWHFSRETCWRYSGLWSSVTTRFRRKRIRNLCADLKIQEARCFRMNDFQKKYLLKRQDFGVLYPYLIEDKVTDINWNGKQLWIDDLEGKIYGCGYPFG